MSLNFRDNQLERARKSNMTPQVQGKVNQAEQGIEAKKTKDKKVKSKKARKDKKRREHPRKWDRQGWPRDSSIAATKANAALATTTGNSGQKKKNTQDASKITCYSCNKKGHFASDYTEL